MSRSKSHVIVISATLSLAVLAASCTIPVQQPQIPAGPPAAPSSPQRVQVPEYTVIETGGTPGAPLVLDGRAFTNGLRIVANDVIVRNSSVVRPGSGEPAVYVLGDRVTLENVTIGGPSGGSEGLRLEGGADIVLRGVRVEGLAYAGPDAHSDALQVHLQRPLTNLLIENSYFDGTVHGDPNQETANGSQIDGARGAISGTIRNTTFTGGRYYSGRYYNVTGPLVLQSVVHTNEFTTNTPGAVVITP